MSLYDVLKKSGSPTEFKKYGFEYDAGLSTKNNQIYFNPDTKKLLYIARPTNPRNIADLRTDVSLAMGGLKGTKRYTDSKKLLEKATEKYNPDKRILTGYSLGGSIVSGLGSKGKGDEIYTYNKGTTIGQKSRGDMEKSYRTKGDLVSLTSKYDNNVKTLDKSPSVLDYFGEIGKAFNSHKLDQLKKNNIDIDSMEFQKSGEPVSSNPTTIEGNVE